ncbi:SnoaL-like domain protein [compost metagenome]
MGDSFSGAGQIRKGLDLGFSTYPDGKIIPIAAHADHENGMAEWYFEFSNSDGQKIQIHGVDIFKFKDGKVQSKNVYVKHYL